MEKGRVSTFLKDKKSWGAIPLEQKLAKNDDGLLRWHCHLTGHLYKLELVDSPGRDTCKQASQMASHVLCDCEALVVLRLRHLGSHFFQAVNNANISVSNTVQFVQSVRLLNV